MNYNDHETKSTRVFIVMIEGAELVYSTETDSIFSVVSTSSTQRQT